MTTPFAHPILPLIVDTDEATIRPGENGHNVRLGLTAIRRSRRLFRIPQEMLNMKHLSIDGLSRDRFCAHQSPKRSWHIRCRMNTGGREPRDAAVEEVTMTRAQEVSGEGAWSVILAGGEGERTRSFIEKWLGYHRPKQYCVGRRSLFQHTVDRADRMAPPKRRVAVVAEDHRDEVFGQLRGRAPGTVILQPQNRGTAPGVFLALTYVKAREPDAIVTLFPSDHFVHPEDRFALAVAEARGLAREMEERLVLLGVRPEGPETEYGWIETGLDRESADGFRAGEVRGFVEKPFLGEARRALFRGALWNTLIVTGKLTAFWKLGFELLPEMMELFEELGRAVGKPEEEARLKGVYRSMPVRDFSSDVLQRCPKALIVVELSGVAWSDWGCPKRIRDTLRAIGKEPAFADERCNGGRASDLESKMLFSAARMPEKVLYGEEKVDRRT